MRFICRLLSFVIAMSIVSGCQNLENELPRTQEETVMQDGEYEGLGEGRSGMIKVAVVVSNHIITAIRILSQSESHFAQPAEQQIIDEVLEKC